MRCVRDSWGFFSPLCPRILSKIDLFPVGPSAGDLCPGIASRGGPLFALDVGLVPLVGRVVLDAIGDDMESLSARTLLDDSCLKVGGREGYVPGASLAGGLGASSLL